jgi:hypothetical protein
MRNWWYLHRTAALIGVGAMVVVVAVSVVIAVRPASSTARTASGTPSPAGPSKGSGPTVAARRTGVAYHPRYITPPDTAAQENFDAELVHEENPTAIAAAEALAVPVGRYSHRFARVDPANTDDAIAYADAFVAELLNVSYRDESRVDLLAWAQAESAANSLPGVPSSIGDKSLYASLADPDMPGTGGGTSPVPSVADWAARAKAGVVEHPGGLTAGVDRAWSELIGQGFIPKDPLMSLVDVSGTLTVTTTRPVTSTARRVEGKGNPRHIVARPSSHSDHHQLVEHFSLVLGVGGALGHPGYGASAVQSWKVSG